MKIAIIGATGLIGNHAAREAIKAGHELTVIHRQTSNLDQLNDIPFHSVIADLADKSALTAALSGINAVINCAGYYPTLPRPWQDDVTQATTQMESFYAACAEHNLDRIVHVGGSVALKRHPHGLPGDESLEYPAQPADKNPYLQVKWHMDRLAIEQAKAGLPVAIGIPATTLGEYDVGPTTGRLVVEVANQTMPAYIEGQRNVIYAGDAGRGLVLVCEAGKAGERYLLTGTNIMMSELIERIAVAAGVTAPRSVSLRLAKMVAKTQLWRYRFFNGEPPRISETVIGVMSAGQYLDGGKAENDLGFKATTSVDETIERTLTWFKKSGTLGACPRID